MDSKIKFILLLLICPALLNAQGKNFQKYIDSSELLLKQYATEVFYFAQENYVDSTANQKNRNIFIPSYFQSNNYSFEAIKTIMDFAEKEAIKDYISVERGKCFCLNSSLLFYSSKKLDKKVKSLRKYLSKPPK